MKSKAEILKAVDTCAHTSGRCIECPYCDDTAHCVDSLVADLREALIKSDFEIMKEILSRATQVKADSYVPVSGEGNVIEVSSSKDEVAWIWFDEEENII